MTQHGALKKFLSLILAGSILFRPISIHCETPAKISKSTAILGSLVGISGIAITCLTTILATKSSETRQQQNKIDELEQKIKDFQLKKNTLEQTQEKLNLAIKTNDELHATWYATYYCATTGMIAEHNDWLEIAQKCTDCARINTKVRENLDALFIQSTNQNISKRDFIFNILAATYFSKSLPLGTKNDDILASFSHGHWLYCCGIRECGDASANDTTFSACKNLAITLFTDALEIFDVHNPQESHLRSVLQSEFIEVLKSV